MLHSDVHGRPYIVAAHGWHCSLCGLPFAADAALFMIQGDERRAFYTNQQCETVPVCASCLGKPPEHHRVRMQKANRKVRCMGCEREMIACVKDMLGKVCAGCSTLETTDGEDDDLRELRTAVCAGALGQPFLLQRLPSTQLQTSAT